MAATSVAFQGCCKCPIGRFPKFIMRLNNLSRRFHLSSFAAHLPNFESQESTIKTTPSVYDKKEFKWLSNFAPGFHVNGNNIRIIYQPKDFYDQILEKINKAKHRITLASLYIGTGSLEKQLVCELQEALERNKGSLKALILLDFTRGSRSNPNSRSLLQPLLKFDSLRVALYHTPKLRGLLKKLIPHRWNEIIGLQHMKAFIFDDSVIISGANLSQDYFTNRQDRYIILDDCKELADYLDDIIETVAKFSLELRPDGSTELNSVWHIHPFLDDSRKFRSFARTHIHELLCKSQISSFNNNVQNARTTSILQTGDTVVYPLVQMGPLKIHQDETVTKILLSKASDGTQITLASGYFNLTNGYINVMLEESQAVTKILMASPKVNGFYGAHGVAGAIPAAYTRLAYLFFKRIHQLHQEYRIHLLEYERPDWTFHAKGLWYYVPQEDLPVLTMIGSPNFGYRSVHRDLELQLLLLTENEKLQWQLKKEEDHLLHYGKPITWNTFKEDERQVPLWVRAVTRWFQDYF